MGSADRGCAHSLGYPKIEYDGRQRGRANLSNKDGPPTVMPSWKRGEAPLLGSRCVVEQPSGRRSSNGIGAVRPARILLLEDDGRLRQMLCEGLQEEGFEVTPAADGVEALALVG